VNVAALALVEEATVRIGCAKQSAQLGRAKREDMMKGCFTRRGVLAIAAAGLAAGPSAAWAQAQAWPSRPVTMILPFAAGGGTDLLARALAQDLTERFGQQFVVDNRTGAGGNVGAAAVAKAAPDGYTLLFGTPGPLANNKLMYKNLPFDPEQAFTPIVLIAKSPLIIAAKASLPVKDIKELAAYAKANPGKLNYSSGGVGNFSHLGLAMLAFQTGVNIVHVPYRGIGPATTAILAGEVQLTYNNVATAKPHVDAGKLTGLGVGTSTRLPALPDVPAIAETVPGFNVTPWVGIFAPAKTPKEITERLSKEVDALLKDPAVVKNFADQQIRAAYLDTPEFTAEIKKETDAWEKVIKTMGIKVE
jgi:tripartite-type tricarboxylate transporter receptor subunit TctC